ncbi:DegV family protein [Heliobacterium mobile]|uniref:DegV family protein n=1 Tax=Heliobacterium mobile TaxID=28064 RepID=UPI0014781BF4|nr:DegV family protein [Heliobacterium mobile]
MSKIHLVTDSTAYLTEEEIRQLQVSLVSLRVIVNNEPVEETAEDPERFIEYLRNAPTIPTTSQPPPGELLDVYDRLTANGDTVISLHLSSKLSGTFQAAKSMADHLEGRPIHVIDTETTAIGLRILLEAARKLIDAGMSTEEVIREIVKVRERLRLFLIVDSMEYLYRGGRIGGAQSLFGTLLQIKPVLWVKEGKVEVYEKIRTRKKAFLRVAEFVRDKWNSEGPQRIALAYVGASAEVQELQEQIISLVPDASPTIHFVGPVIAVHVGPGTVGVAMAPLE